MTREERYHEALEQIRVLVEGKADCDCAGDPPTYRPNDYMVILTTIDEVLGR